MQLSFYNTYHKFAHFATTHPIDCVQMFFGSIDDSFKRVMAGIV